MQQPLIACQPTGAGRFRYSRNVNYAQLLLPDFSSFCLVTCCAGTPPEPLHLAACESLVYYLLFPVLLFQSIVKARLTWALRPA